MKALDSIWEISVKIFQDRLRRNPRNFIHYTTLGQMHMRKARESGDVAAYQQAEATFRKALQLLPDYSPAEANLASALYAQHRFTQALEVAQRVYKRDPGSIHALATMGDARLALGKTWRPRRPTRS